MHRFLLFGDEVDKIMEDASRSRPPPLAAPGALAKLPRLPTTGWVPWSSARGATAASQLRSVLGAVPMTLASPHTGAGPAGVNALDGCGGVPLHLCRFVRASLSVSGVLQEPALTEPIVRLIVMLAQYAQYGGEYGRDAAAAAASPGGSSWSSSPRRRG